MKPILELQKYLRSGKTPDDLKAEYGVNYRAHTDYANLVLFKYNMQESPLGEKIVQECRGIILDQDNNWEIIAFPYEKFFNVGELHAATLDMPSARFLEKLDGSIMTLYYYNGWHVASSGSPDASGETNPALGSKTFAQVFWDVWKDLGYVLPTSTRRNYMFEMMTPFNRIVCRYAESNIVLHGVRNLDTLQEEVPDTWAESMNCRLVRCLDYHCTLEDALEIAKFINPMDGEGYVVVDKFFRRVKVKSPQYVALSHLKDGISTKRLLEIVRTNEFSEFLTYFPEFTDVYEKVKTRYYALIKEIEESYSAIKHVEIQKDFAFLALKKPYSQALFWLRTGQVESATQFCLELHVNKLFQMIGGSEVFKEDDSRLSPYGRAPDKPE